MRLRVLPLAAGWCSTVGLAVLIGFGTLPVDRPGEGPAGLRTALLVGLPLLVLGLVLLLRRRWRPALAPAGDWALGIVFYGWLYGVPLLLLIGLIRRVTVLPFDLSFDEARAYARTTDAFLTAGLWLNAVLPLLGLFGAWWWRERLPRFVRALVGALVVFGLVWLIAGLADAPLFGHLPRWEKP
jgi:hypothetical protein